MGVIEVFILGIEGVEGGEALYRFLRRLKGNNRGFVEL
jgi:hypothetical protein